MNEMGVMTIVVARPGDAGAELCSEIVTQFGRALHVPAIGFAPPDDLEGFQAAIEEIDKQDWLIFNSPQSVTATVPAMRARWPHLPESVQFAAVGAGTNAALQAAGYRANLVPDNQWSSEGLLATPELESVCGQHIMIVRGEGGREILERVLMEREAMVTSCIAYKRVLPETDTTVCQTLLQRELCAAVVAGSYETVANFKKLIGDTCWQALAQVPLIVMSERIKTLAAESGFQTIWVTKNASQQAVLDLIAEKKEVLCQRITK